jgi:hypothetical protein
LRKCRAAADENEEMILLLRRGLAFSAGSRKREISSPCTKATLTRNEDVMRLIAVS